MLHSFTLQQARIKYCWLALFCFLTLQGFSQKDAPIWPTALSSPEGTFKELQQDFEKYWEGREIQKGKGYKQFKRWEAYMEPRIYPSGNMNLPRQTYWNYIEWQEKQPHNQKNMMANWTSLGPFEKPTGDDTGVGRLNMVRFDPTNSNTMYVGAPDGGLWKSTNAGASWTTNTDMLGVIGVSDLAINPNNTNIMYLATGDIESDRHSIGVLKSTDGGATWNTTGLVWTEEDDYEISKLLMHPSDPNILLAATDGGVFRTTDGGATWSSPSTIEVFKDMEFKPGDPNTVYAAGKELWRSTNNGVTWTKITSGLPTTDVSRIAIGVTPANSAYVYLLIGNATDNGFKGLYRSTNSGTSFSLRSNSPNVLGFETDGSDAGGQAFYDLAIAVSPVDEDFVTVGGISVWQSDDGGTNWYIVAHWLPDAMFPNFFIHADIHELIYHPSDNQTLFACNDGGISKSTDDGANWTDISNNLVISQQNRIGISASTSDFYIAGLQDIGSIGNLSSPWKIIGGGDGEDCFIDYSNDNNIVFSGTNGYHELSTNGGMSFNPISGALPDGEFFSPIKQDPVVPARIYAGGRPNLYRSNNLGTNWSTLGQPFGGDPIIEFAVAPSNNSIIYAISGTEIAKSTNSGSSWTDITGTLPVGSAALTNLTVSNADANKIWVTFSGYSASHKVYKSTNGGASWTNISTGLPNLPINAIVYHNNTVNDVIYIGADVGVYYTDNTMGSWTSYSTDLPNATVKDLKIYYPTSKLRAATYGRGAWESDLVSAPLPVELMSFNGENKGSENILFWRTATESNLDYYDIERSVNGKEFEKIGSLAPDSPISLKENSYTYRDKTPLEGINYYRLKIMDIDGQYEYSRTISIYLEDEKDGITIAPNPTTASVQIQGLETKNVTVRLIDGLGRLLRTEQLSERNQIDVRNFPNGIYYIEIQQPGSSPVVKRIIKE